MTRHKPRPAVLGILSDLARLEAGLRRLGLPDEAVRRVADVWLYGADGHSGEVRRVAMELIRRRFG